MKFIEEIKARQFKSPQELKEALKVLLERNWHEIANNDALMASEDIDEIILTQKFLLNAMIEIRNQETQVKPEEEELIDQSMDLKHLQKNLDHVTSIHDLYYLPVDHDCYFVGDLHSDAWILSRILDTVDFYEKIMANKAFKLIFLGDYVDRGKHHIKILEHLMILKYLFPDKIYLLMGNHDIGKIENGQVTLYLRKAEEDKDYFYIYLQMLYEKFHFDSEIIDLYQAFLNHLNVAAFVLSDKAIIKGVHGGIPRPDLEGGFDYLTHHKQLTDGTIDHHEITVKDSILWSDPSIQENKPTIERKRFKFYEDQLNNYLKHFNLDVVVRGHQAVETGCLPLFDHKIYTIFSSGLVLEEEKNINPDTAYDFVTPKILHFSYENGLPLQSLDIK